MTRPGSPGLHRCGPGQPGRKRPGRPSGRQGDLCVDVHCHLLTPEAERLVAGAPELTLASQRQTAAAGLPSVVHNAKLFEEVYAAKLTDVATRLGDMDEMGVDVQALSPSPTQYYYWADEDLAKQIVASINENVAAVCATHPGRFVGLATVALQHPELAARQLRHAVETLGLHGVEISSLVNGDDVSESRFEPFWSAVSELKCAVFLHPLGTTMGERLNEHYLSNLVGQPLETSVALSKMIFSGLFDRHRDLRIIAAHGGGYLPLYLGRSDHGYAVRPEAQGCSEPPSEYLKRMWFDTVVYDPKHLRRLIDAVGPQRLVVGTDYPFDMGHYAPRELVAAVDDLSAVDRRAILGGNASLLLGV